MVVNKVYPVYHVSKLKPALTSTLQPPPEPTALPAEVLEQPTREYPVHAILKREIRGGVVKYRVRWGPPYGPANDSWENADEIEKCAALDCSRLNLHGLVTLGLRLALWKRYLNHDMKLNWER